jgi:hypothetical protein
VRQPAPAAAAADGGGGAGSQPAFATQVPSQFAFTQSFTQRLSQDSFAPPSELDFAGGAQSQATAGLSQAAYDSYFDSKQ